VPLKNSIPAKEYLVTMEAFFDLSGGLTGHTPEARTEECESIGPAPIRVYYPIGEEPPRPNFAHLPYLRLTPFD
jgi:hypothetical protein